MYIKFKCTKFKTHYVIGKDIFAQTDARQTDATHKQMPDRQLLDKWMPDRKIYLIYKPLKVKN